MKVPPLHDYQKRCAAAFTASGRRPLSIASHVDLSATARGHLNDPVQ